MKRGTILLIAMVLLFMCQVQAMAGEMDILVRKLVEHGVLTQQDADEILLETRVEAEKERQETIVATREALMAGEDAPLMLAEAIPFFIRNTKIKGDFRLRYQNSDRNGGTEDRNRGRYRFRLGMVTKVNDKVDVGFGIATGGSDPRSTNQTMGNSFDSPDIRLDYAYASYKPLDWLTVVGGKFKNPLWTPVGWLWDSDIRPEGFSMSMNYKVGGVELFINNGFWVLDEIKNSSNDPLMWVFQPGYKVKLGESAYFKNALAVYQFSSVKGTELDFSSGSNTTNPDGTLAKDYDSIVMSGELGCKTGLVLIPFAALYGEYVNNTDTNSKDSGYIAGFKFGHEKVKKAHQWNASAHYQRLERDAWLDIFPDSDAYGGETDSESYVFKFAYGLMEKVSVGTAYYYSKSLTGSSDQEDIVQVDLLFKF